MHIVHLIPNLQVGGAQKIALGLAESARQAGHTVSFVCFMPGQAYGDRLKEAGIAYFSLDYPGSFGLSRLVSLRKLSQQLYRQLEAIQPDLVHVHLFLSKLLLQLASGRATGWPIILTQHDNNPWWQSSRPQARLMRYLDRRFSRRYARFSVAISRSVQQDLQRISGLSEARCPIIYNFVESPAEWKAPRAPQGNAPKLFMITRLDIEKKGIDTALRVLALVQKQFPKATLTLVGQGPDQQQLQGMIQQAGLSESVALRPFTQQIYAVYDEADLLLMPSRWEGFGLTAVEAALAAKPVIGSRVGGLKEVVLEGETGFLCSPEDAEGMAAKACRLWSAPEQYLRIAEQARSSAQQRFDQTHAYRTYESYYQQLSISHDPSLSQ